MTFTLIIEVIKRFIPLQYIHREEILKFLLTLPIFINNLSMSFSNITSSFILILKTILLIILSFNDSVITINIDGNKAHG